VIHELLALIKMPMFVIWNVLIGGPNQSHNITFKELPRLEGKGFEATI